jgi:hypothetical protein
MQEVFIEENDNLSEISEKENNLEIHKEDEIDFLNNTEYLSEEQKEDHISNKIYLEKESSIENENEENDRNLLDISVDPNMRSENSLKKKITTGYDEDDNLFFSLENSLIKTKDKIDENNYEIDLIEFGERGQEKNIKNGDSNMDSELNYFRNLENENSSNLYKINYGEENKSELIQKKSNLIKSEPFQKLNGFKLTKEKKDIEVNCFIKEKSFPQVFHYIIKSENMNKSLMEVRRRYKDFNFLNLILEKKFYFLVLPLLPQKDILLKLTKNKNNLEKIEKGLENYLNNIYQIEEIKNFEPFKNFLFDQEAFQILYTDLEYGSIFKEKSLIKNIGCKFSNVYNFIKNKGSVHIDTGYYGEICKKIEMLHFFTKNFIFNLEQIKQNSVHIFNQAHILSLDDPENHQNDNVFVNKFYDLKAQEKNINSFYTHLEIIVQDIEACKRALERKNEIYTQCFYCEQNLKNLTPNDNSLFLVKKEYEDLKAKINVLDNKLKNQLEIKIYLIHEDLQNIFQSQLIKSFVNLFQF